MDSNSALQQHVAEVSAALVAVYNGSGPSHSKADRWLQDFQRSQEAWSVSDAMLRMESAELNLTFFAAQTIHAKIRSNFQELPCDSVPSLRDSLVEHLARWSIAGDPALVTRLCLALSALAVQINWPDVVKDLTGRLMVAGPPEQRNQAARVLLQFMKVLPEEATSHRLVIMESTRESFLTQLRGSSDFLLTSLAQIAAGPLGAEVMVQETVFQCLQSWIRHVDVPGEEVARNPILSAAFDALEKVELHETAVDFLVEVLRKYKASNYEIVQLMVPKAMAQESAYKKAVEEEDEDVARGLCRLFTEMGEHYIELIMAPDDRGQLKLVQLVLLCTSHPEAEIATIPLYFWYCLCRTLHSLEPAQLRNARYAMFGQCIIDLIGILLVLMRYPEDVEHLTDDKVDDLKRHRYEVADVLHDVCLVLGGVQTLRQVVYILEQELNTMSNLAQPDARGSWQAVESCLFGIRAVGKEIPVDEGEVMPRVVAILPRLPSNSFVRKTATLIVGKYSDWLKVHPEHLTAMFGLLMDGFSTPEVTPAVATATKLVCHSCGELMGEPALGVLQEQLRLAKSRKEKISHKDELEILEGLAHVISTLQPAPAANAIRRLVEPMVAGLQKDGVESGDVRSAQHELDRLTVVVSHFNKRVEADTEHPVAALVRDIWSILETTSTRHRSSAQVFEKLSRFFKHAMRNCRGHFEPLLKPLISHLVKTFAEVPHSPYLYCGSICVTEFGRRGPHFAALIFQMLNDFSGTVFRCLQSLDDFTANPDMVEEFFYLVGRVVDYCPGPLVSSPLLSSIVRCGIVGLQLHHREAQRGVLHCFQVVIALAIPEGPLPRPNLDAVRFTPSVEKLLRDHGQAMVQELVKCCVGELPSHSIDGEPASVSGVLWRISLLCPSWLQEWVENALKTVSPKVAGNFERAQFMQALFAPEADRSKMGYDRAVAQFCSICFQNQRSWAS